ncbi:MAG TPA: hypothetical protein VGR30_05880 [Candidatus Binatia bacterium]|jgi:hypothetical protein|nr:hypothetical protein [Candidatus Binatia bacterium]
MAIVENNLVKKPDRGQYKSRPSTQPMVPAFAIQAGQVLRMIAGLVPSFFAK